MFLRQRYLGRARLVPRQPNERPRDAFFESKEWTIMTTKSTGPRRKLELGILIRRNFEGLCSLSKAPLTVP